MKNLIPSAKEKVAGRHVGSMLGLSMEEIKVLRRVKDEYDRRGGFIRIFPTPLTWDVYGPFLEHKTTMNYMLATRLFHERGGSRKGPVPRRARLALAAELGLDIMDCNAQLHAALYERKLLSLEVRKQRRRFGKLRPGRLSRLSGTSQSADFILKSETECEEEEEIEDEELEICQSETADSLRNMQVKFKPQLTEIVKPPHQGKLPKDPEEKPINEGVPLQDKVEPVPKNADLPFNLLQILRENRNLSKVQARRAFSAYLQRVQLRLMKEAGDEVHNPVWAAKEDEQMELVVRFLKRAASNLQQSLKMLLPSRRLALYDRRRILAHQLGEFIICYNRETDQMSQKKIMKKQEEEEEEGVDEEGFHEFVTKASESDLEEVLTFYTHKNKSASVFLGTNPGATKHSNSQLENKNKGNNSEKMGKNEKQQSLPVEKENVVEQLRLDQPKRTSLPRVPSSTEDGENTPQCSIPNPSSCTHGTILPQSISIPLSSQPAACDNVQTAMQIYSQRLTRPSSAKAAGSRSHSPSRQRGASARTNKDGEDNKRYSHDIAAELQRLAEKQAARQYSPPSHISLLSQQLTNLNMINGAVNKVSATASNYRSPLNPGGSFWAFQTHSSTTDTRPSSLTLRTLESDSFAWEGDTENSIHSKLIGSQPVHPKTPASVGSYQLHFALQQLQQQKLQSRQLLDQSRARHQALFANFPTSSISSTTLSSGSCSHRTSSSISRVQNAPSLHKVVSSHSASSHLVPKPPASHRQTFIRKVASQRMSKINSTERQLNGFQNSLNSATSCEPLANSTGFLEAGPQIIFARARPLYSRTCAIDTIVGKGKKRPEEGGPA
ncbi:tubulin polyglutamylase TTLL5 isoform X2 [Python bivittatus]|uniref:Tubulin polyglutamylase TTLL5 isoform X2 n=1 Tax=Python bivittatus TaxID=176946 RepID=A0A9F5IWN6_PYTBI|nr:tubulin polyglutamylase TTLL5 isoform X2 [Python bivittatus]